MVSPSLPSFLVVAFYFAYRSASVAWALSELLAIDRRQTFPAIRASGRKSNRKNQTHIGRVPQVSLLKPGKSHTFVVLPLNTLAHPADHRRLRALPQPHHQPRR
jgi:hypothetical protein